MKLSIVLHSDQKQHEIIILEDYKELISIASKIVMKSVSLQTFYYYNHNGQCIQVNNQHDFEQAVVYLIKSKNLTSLQMYINNKNSNNFNDSTIMTSKEKLANDFYQMKLKDKVFSRLRKYVLKKHLAIFEQLNNSYGFETLFDYSEESIIQMNNHLDISSIQSNDNQFDSFYEEDNEENHMIKMI